MANQSKDFEYFVNHHDEIFEKYPNSFVVIQNEQVLFSADSIETAVAKAIESGLAPGTFIVQECTEGNSGYTQTFHTRVIFA